MVFAASLCVWVVASVSSKLIGVAAGVACVVVVGSGWESTKPSWLNNLSLKLTLQSFRHNLLGFLLFI